MNNAVVYITDGNPTNLIYLKHSIQSLLRNSQILFDVCVVCDDKCSELVKSISNIIKIIPTDFKNVRNIRLSPMCPVRTTATFERLFLPSNPQLSQYDRIMYLDCDTEIFKDINIIFKLSECDAEIVGRCEGYAHQHLKLASRICIDNNIRCNTNTDRDYINAGMIVMNLKNILQSDYQNRIKYIIDNYNAHPFNMADQDIINMYFSIKTIGKQYFGFTDDFENEDKTIIHYVCQSGKNLLNERIG